MPPTPFWLLPKAGKAQPKEVHSLFSFSVSFLGKKKNHRGTPPHLPTQNLCTSAAMFKNRRLFPAVCVVTVRAVAACSRAGAPCPALPCSALLSALLASRAEGLFCLQQQGVCIPRAARAVRFGLLCSER